MKNARTRRTLGRVGIRPESIGFAGYTPTGKAVRRHARQQRAEKRLLRQLPTPIVQAFFRAGISQRASIKAGTRYLKSPSIVQDAWLKSVSGSQSLSMAERGLL